MSFNITPRQMKQPLVMHIVYRLDVGGLENGLVNLINHMPPERYRHAIVCLTNYTSFRKRIQRGDVPIIALYKREGNDIRLYFRLWKVLRKLSPDIVHTRNLPGLEYLPFAALAGVHARIHGEHGRDIYDLDGSNMKYNLLRKLMRPFIQHYTAVSRDLADWLVHCLGVHPHQVTQIYNGVDLERFYPVNGLRIPVGPDGFAPSGTLVIGTAGRLEVVKDQLTLIRAFLHLLRVEPDLASRLRLVIIGDGTLRGEAKHLLKRGRAENFAWLPGERRDVPKILRGLDLFVLPSLAEGISNTILEAMATGLPVVATRVGGNPELVEEGKTGILVPSGNPIALAEAIRTYTTNNDLLTGHGQAGRKRVETRFSLEAMVNGYLEVYDKVLSGRDFQDQK